MGTFIDSYTVGTSSWCKPIQECTAAALFPRLHYVLYMPEYELHFIRNINTAVLKTLSQEIICFIYVYVADQIIDAWT